MRPTRVIKVGGSLLGRPNLLDDLFAWWSTLDLADDWLLVGGGQMIDAVRVWDRLRPTDPTDVHWQCVEMLRHSRQHLIAAMHADGRWRDRMNGTPAEFQVVDPTVFYHRDAGSPLPENWDTTTDAIAMWIGVCLEADEVILLKSCDVPAELSLGDWIDRGIIDPACDKLPEFADRLSVQRLPAAICH